jgi:hypothetical protein
VVGVGGGRDAVAEVAAGAGKTCVLHSIMVWGRTCWHSGCV